MNKNTCNEHFARYILLLSIFAVISVLTGTLDVAFAADGLYEKSAVQAPLILAAADKNKNKKTKPRKRPRTRGSEFDHVGTGFILSGAHMRAGCDECHVDGMFKGTPTDCAGCHDRGRVAASTRKPANHIRTLLGCEQCHSTRTWFGAVFDHSEATPGTCINCHNNATAPGKPAGHIVTTASCDDCHNTSSWLPAGFRHLGVTPGTCITCHNGTTATGKPGGHVVTTASCDACHSTNAWTPAGFDHATVAPGTCSTCHNGTTATGKPGGHFVTTQQCDSCHSTSAWLPVSSYTHNSPNYKQHRSSVTCTACHTGNNEVIIWPFAAYQPECAACHANNYETGPHKKTEVPTTIFYTVNELKDCSGSCHVYTDNTFSTILKSRSGEHRSSAADF